MYYAIKLKCIEHKSFMLGQFQDKSQALEFLYSKMSLFEENQQIILVKDNDEMIIKVYNKIPNIVIGYTKELTEVYQIIEYPKSALKKAIIMTLKKKIDDVG